MFEKIEDMKYVMKKEEVKKAKSPKDFQSQYGS